MYDLTAMGFHLFPILWNTKLPAVAGFPTRASRTPGELFGNRQCNVGISTTRFQDDKALLVVDVDVNKGGTETMEFLVDMGLDFPPTLTQITATGGQHLIYWVEEAVSQSAGLLGRGIDTRSKGGYIVGAGSEIDGKQYTFKDPSVSVAKAPTWLVEKHKRAPKIHPRADLKLVVNQEVAERRAIEYLGSLDFAPEGERNQKAYAAAAKIKDFGLTLISAQVCMAQAFKAEPLMEVEEINHVVNSAYSYGQNSPGVDSPEAAFTVIKPEPEPPHPFQVMNQEYAFALAGGGAQVLWFTTDVRGDKTTEFLSVNTFMHKLSNQKIQIGKSEKPIAVEWMEWKNRRSYDGIIFKPNYDNPRFYNSWQGFTCKPAASTNGHRPLELFKDHIIRNVCQGNLEHASWVFGWMAHLFQKPEEKPRTAFVLKGKKGTGKSAIFSILRKVIGAHFLSVANRRYLTGNFNGHVEGKLLYVLEEAFWSGEKGTDGILKDLVTGETHMIERKGREAYQVDNLCRVAILGNEEWIVPATEDERRYAVFEISNDNRLDDKFFGDMLKMDPAVLLKFFMDFYLSQVDVNKIPNTKALGEQKEETQTPFKKWWRQCLEQGSIVGRGIDVWPEKIATDDFRASFMVEMKAQNISGRMPDVRRMGRVLKEISPTITHHRVGPREERRYQYSIPPLAQARLEWENYIGHKIEWELDEDLGEALD